MLIYTSSSNRHICQGLASEACSSVKWFWWKIFCIISTQVTWMSLSKWILMAKGVDFKSAPAWKEVYGEKRQIASAFTAFTAAQNFARKFWFQQQIQNFAHIYRTSRKNLLCIFRERKCRSENGIGCICSFVQMMCSPNICLDAPFCPRNNNSRNIINCSHEPLSILSVVIFTPKKCGEFLPFIPFVIDSCHTNCQKYE